MKNYSVKAIFNFAIAGLISAHILSSCNKSDLLDKKPITSLNTTAALKTETDYVALTNSAYDPLQWQTITGPEIFPVMFQDIRADNCVSQWASYWTYGAIFDDLSLIKSNNTNVALLWQKWYTAIARANTAMHFDSLFDGFKTPGLQQRLIAEAKFIRAFSYFQLVTNWGGVPLIVSYIGSTSDNLLYHRSAAEEVYAQIDKDLQDASAILPLSYTGADLGRATSGAAYTLLAKENLYQKKYAEVVKYTDMVIQSNVYSLEANFADNWNLNNEYGKESIFEIGYQSGFFSPQLPGFENQGSLSYEYFGFLGAGTGTFGNCVPRQGLIDLYDSTDTRKDATFIIPNTFLPDLNQTANFETDLYQYFWTVPAALESKASCRKYYIPKNVALGLTNIASSPLNEKILRYSDVLLMNAEACLVTGDAEGLQNLNMVIQRAYGGDPSHNLTSYTLADVKLQKRLEFATEGWDRFTDLVRWGDADSVLAFKHFTPGRDELLPIPQSEIDLVGANVLTQNPGY